MSDNNLQLRLLLLPFINTVVFYSGPSPAEAPPGELSATHVGAVVDAECLHRPGQAQAHQDVKHITAYGVGDGHVSQTCGKESNAVKVYSKSGDKSVMTSTILLYSLHSISAT